MRWPRRRQQALLAGLITRVETLRELVARYSGALQERAQNTPNSFQQLHMAVPSACVLHSAVLPIQCKHLVTHPANWACPQQTYHANQNLEKGKIKLKNEKLPREPALQ